MQCARTIVVDCCIDLRKIEKLSKSRVTSIRPPRTLTTLDEDVEATSQEPVGEAAPPEAPVDDPETATTTNEDAQENSETDSTSLDPKAVAWSAILSLAKQESCTRSSFIAHESAPTTILRQSRSKKQTSERELY